MQVVQMLSDLTTLQICDPAAALALVSARPDGTSGLEKTPSQPPEENDPDLKRAKDLLGLHATVKLAHQDGTDKDLNEARRAVEDVLRTM